MALLRTRCGRLLTAKMRTHNVLNKHSRRALHVTCALAAIVLAVSLGLARIIPPAQPVHAATAAPATGSTAPLLPGETLWNGVPSDLFGLGDTYNYESTGFRNNTTIQAEIKNAHVPLIRDFFEGVDEQDHVTPIPDSTQIAIAQAIQNSGAVCMANLTQNSDESTSALQQSDITYFLHLVSLLSQYGCKYYEVMNEPDLSGAWPPQVSQANYSAFWDAFVPQARAQTPGVYFGGPALATEFGLSDPNFMQNWLSDAASHSVAPDFVSYHWYMCSGIAQSSCLSQVDTSAPGHGKTVAGWLTTDFPGKSIPLGITEWSADPGNPSYANDDSFMSQFEQHALAGLEQNPYLAFATQFDIGAEAGYGTLDVFRVDASNPYTNTAPAVGSPRPMFYVLQEEIGRESTGVPHYAHVIQIPEENHGYSQIVGDTTDAPYINNTLIPGGALATNYFANVASSMPNYWIWQFGTDGGQTANCEPAPGCEYSGPSIASEADAAGINWGGYEENSTANCQNVVDGGTGGLYTVHHDPFPYDTALTDCSTKDVNFSNFASALSSPTTLPGFVFLGPNLNDDMHNGTIAQGDTWLQQEIPAIQNSTACTQSSCLIVVAFDESFDATNEQVMAAMIGPDVPPGTKAATRYDHYALTHTMEQALTLGTLNSGDAAAPLMTDMFGPWQATSGGGTPTPTPTNPPPTATPTNPPTATPTPSGGGGTASFSVVQHKATAASGTVTSLAATLPTGVKQGDLLIASVGEGSNLGAIGAPSGWSTAYNTLGSGQPVGSAEFYDVVTSAQAGQTSWNFTLSAAHSLVVNLMEVSASNGWQSTVLDKAASNDQTGSNTTALSTGSTAATTNPNDFVVANFAVHSGAQTWSNLTSGYTSEDTATDGTGVSAMDAYVAKNATGVQSAAVTASTAGYSVNGIAAFAAVAGSSNPAPVVSSFSPTSGHVGDSVTLSGSGFTGANAVTFNGTASGSVTVASDTSLSATVPSGATSGVICVTSAYGTGCSSASFSVLQPAPTVSSFSPTDATVGTDIVVTGTNFTGATSVAFNGTNAPGYAVNSSTQITVAVPSGATTGPISVTTPGGTGTSASNFTVDTVFACAEFVNSAQDVGTCTGGFDSPAVQGETSCVVIRNGAMVAGSCRGSFAP